MVVAFHPSGQYIAAAGFRTADQRTIHIFDTAIPGRQSNTLLLGKTKRSKDGQKGLVSALTYGPARHGQQNLVVVGTYAPGSIYVYDQRAGPQRSGTVLNDGHCLVGQGESSRRACNKRKRFDADLNVPVVSAPGEQQATGSDAADDITNNTSWLSSAKSKWFQSRAKGGITQLQFGGSGHEYVLYSASRRSNTILAWDLRMLSDQEDFVSRPCSLYGLSSFATENDTNQRLQFDLNETGDTLYSAGSDNCVRIYDTKSGVLEGVINKLGDAANGVSFCVVSELSGTQQAFVAVTTGSRHFPSEDDFENELIHTSSCNMVPGSIRLYKV
jgi:WD40 repeat protein